MAKHFILVAASCIVLCLAACGEKTPDTQLQPGGIEVATNDAAAVQKKGTIEVKGERITIPSLDYWLEFNFDGNFSDNCRDFLRNFTENQSELYEFNTVEICNLEIIRDPEVYGRDLAFNFTVVQSEMKTLPVGTYKTIVKDLVDCYMVFSGDDPTDIFPAVTVSDAATIVSAWLHSTYSWFLPEYGQADITVCINYLIDRYGNGEKLLYEDFARLAAEKLGVTVNKEHLTDYLTIEDGRLYVLPRRIGGNTAFRIISEEKRDAYTEVTVQFFAECNGFILSDTVEYHIGEKEELLGCKVISSTPYTPYGLRNAFS